MIDLLLKALSLIPFYFIGAFPTGHIVGRLRGVDVEHQGSGNVGATNVARTVGTKFGLMTLVVDTIKGWLGCLLAACVSNDPNWIALVGLALVAGHCFSIPGKLKGGKGVAASLGVVLFLDYRLASAGLSFFALMLYRFRIVSLASITALILVGLWAIFAGVEGMRFYALGAMILMVVFRHKENIQRIIEGREPHWTLSGNS